MKRMSTIIFAVILAFASISADPVVMVMNHAERSDTLAVYISQIDSAINAQLEVYMANGYWNAQVQIEQHEGNVIEAKFIPGDISKLKHVHFSGITEKNAHYLSKEFTMGHPDISSNHLIAAVRRLDGFGYRLDGSPVLSIDNQDDFHLTYKVLDYPDLRVQGLATFNQSGSSDTLSWHGQINVSIPNFDGRGKSFDFSWERLKSNSESFSVGLTYPWIYQLPLKGFINFGREVVEGNYQIIQTNLGLAWDIDWERSIYFSFERIKSIITYEGTLLHPEWINDKKRLMGLGYRQSSLNSQNHSGFALKTTLFQELNHEPESIKRFNLRSEAELGISRRVYVSQRTAAVIQNHTVATNDPSILMPLGGANSVRGYEESFLRSPNIVSMQQTLHYTFNGNSQLFAFYDLGFHNAEASIDNIQGYGLGVQLRSGRGPVRIILASHEGLELNNSFLHIEYSGGREWIDR